MPDPNLSIPDSSTPGWVFRYAQWRTDYHRRSVQRSSRRLTGWRTQRRRRLLVSLLIVTLLLSVGSAVASFWSMAGASIPFAVGVFGAVIAILSVRTTNGLVADAPADALDEFQLAARNAARSATYLVLLFMVLGVYAVLMALSYRDYVAGHTVGAVGWLLISLTLTATCIPDILISWWMPDAEPSSD